MLYEHIAQESLDKSSYNFEGRNSGKHAFKDLIIFSIVLGKTIFN